MAKLILARLLSTRLVRDLGIVLTSTSSPPPYSVSSALNLKSAVQLHLTQQVSTLFQSKCHAHFTHKLQQADHRSKFSAIVVSAFNHPINSGTVLTAK